MGTDWASFCSEVVPSLLFEWGADEAFAAEVGADLRVRAEGYAVCGARARDVLRAPFFEETVGYEPRQAPASVLTSVTVVVRCSLLEQAHAHGPVDAAGIRGLTALAAGPLLEYLNGCYNLALDDPPARPFAGLDTRYPRAWAALGPVAGHSGGRVGFRAPDGSVPALPGPGETVDADRSSVGHVLLSGIDPRFDSDALRFLAAVAAGDTDVLVVSHLSRLSRNIDKLLRVLEFVLARGGQVLTTNYLLRNGETWVRAKGLVAPSSTEPFRPLRELRGLSGAHRRTVQQVLRTLT